MAVEAIAFHCETTFCALREAASSTATASERVKRTIFIFKSSWDGKSFPSAKQKWGITTQRPGSVRDHKATRTSPAIDKGGQAANVRHCPSPEKQELGLSTVWATIGTTSRPRRDFHGQQNPATEHSPRILHQRTSGLLERN